MADTFVKMKSPDGEVGIHVQPILWLEPYASYGGRDTVRIVYQYHPDPRMIQGRVVYGTLEEVAQALESKAQDG